MVLLIFLISSRNALSTIPLQEKTQKKREWAEEVLREHYDLLLCYDECPIGGNERYKDWVGARPEIIEKLNEAEKELNQWREQNLD